MCFVVQRMIHMVSLQESTADLVLPELPSNARYVNHGNTCYDWGTFGWALFNLDINIDKYKYFFFMNSSVRGPFLPPYWPVGSHPEIRHASFVHMYLSLPLYCK